MTLRRILKAFKTSFIMIMKLKTVISSLKIKFNKIYMNYSLRIIQLFKYYSIKTRISTSFPSYNNDNELDWDKYLD